MKKFRQCIIAFALTFTAIMLLLQIGIARSNAQPGLGCETIHWGFLGSQRRTICDGPKLPDGSWNRLRIIWTPAHYVPVSCYRWSCWGGYPVDESMQARETYPVNDAIVLPDEPGWLPTGMDVLR